MINYSTEYHDGTKILKIDAKNYPKLATIEDDPNIMSICIKKIAEDPMIKNIIIEQEEDISYYEDTVSILREFGKIYFSLKPLLRNYYRYLLASNPLYHEYREVIDILDKGYLYDPIGSYVRLKRLARKIEFLLSKNNFLQNAAKPLLDLIYNFLNNFESLGFFKSIKNLISGYKIGDRSIYKRLFIADIKPKFIFIKYLSKIPEDAEVIETYKIDENTEVTIFKRKDSIQKFYYIFPEEYKLFEEDLIILNKAREILIQYQPKREDYLDPDRLKEIYEKIIDNILISLSNSYKIPLSEKRYEVLKNILMRYTIGFGILEILAKDEKIQDIFVNPPPGTKPISIIHADYDLCSTNIIPTKRELESWATKLRLISGRPFDEANPVLDSELHFGDIRLRVAAVMEPLSPKGLAYVFRRHRTKPWTLPLFIENKMLSPLAAGLLSFLVDNGRTILIAGTRGAGKTSLLTALMLELPRNIRIITIEDTLEIPVDYFRKLGYNIVSLKVKSPFALKAAELSAEDGVRVSLRLGDSALIVGEVRSKEALVLYEAMRVGALANAVMGTIHAESPYGVYDRVVNDLGIPKTSFKATDIIVIANPIKDPSGLKRYRRVIRITEVRKHWEEDPLKEKGFIDLMVYDINKDQLMPTQNLINGDSDILKSVASRVKILASSWEKIWENIEIRAKCKQMLVEFSKKYNRRDLLEADFVVLANDILHKIIENVVEDYGDIVKAYVLENFKKWLVQKL